MHSSESTYFWELKTRFISSVWYLVKMTRGLYGLYKCCPRKHESELFENFGGCWIVEDEVAFVTKPFGIESWLIPENNNWCGTCVGLGSDWSISPCSCGDVGTNCLWLPNNGASELLLLEVPHDIGSATYGLRNWTFKEFLTDGTFELFWTISNEE